MLVPPLAHGVDNRPQVPPLCRKSIFIARGVLAVEGPVEHSHINQAVEALTKNVP
jgi:hypothetical protein